MEGRRRQFLDDGRMILGGGFALLLVSSGVNSYKEAAALEYFWIGQLLVDLIRDLGIAFIVGAAVSLTIERVSRARFQRHIEKEITAVERGVLNAAYLKRYPPAYTAFLEDMIMKNSFLRIGSNIIVDLLIPQTEIRDASGELMLFYDKHVSFKVKNITSDVQEYTPSMFLDKDWDGVSPELLLWSVDGTSLNPKQLEESVTDTGSDFQTWYKFPKPITIVPGQEVIIISKMRNRKYLRDSTTWCCIQPCDSLRFTINHPEQFQVYAQAKTSARGSDQPHESDGRRVVIEIFTPMLPYVTVDHSWRPSARRESPSAADTIGTALHD